MSEIKIEIHPLPLSQAKKYLTANTHEAVLYFMEGEEKNGEKKKKNPVYQGIGTRPTHTKLLPQLVKEKILTDSHAPILYRQREWGVGEIFFYFLGARPSEFSNLFRLESFTDRFRMAGGDLLRHHLQNLKRKKDAFLLIDMSGLQNTLQQLGFNTGGDAFKRITTAFAEGLYLGGYQYEEYKKSLLEASVTIILLFTDKDHRLAQESEVWTRSRIAAQGVTQARHLVNAPANTLNSEAFVQQVRKIASSLKVNCDIFGKNQLKKMRFNALLAVNSGSRHEAKLAVLDNRYSKKGKKGKTILLVGKGVLFDSGGLSLKPSQGMAGMKMDMAGAAAVLSAFEALVKRKVQARIVTVIPLTDNMTGENAMKVGDVLRTRSGKTVEVLNTDAEGRLILCDALNYGIETYRPDYILDLATLTGACMVALGTYYAGLFTPGDGLAEKLLQSSRNSDEPIWRLPLDNLYLKELHSDIADLKNIGSSYGGAITAAKFLEQFVPEKYRPHWAHLDIAPVMDYPQTKGYQVKGGSGFGVRLIIDFVEGLVKDQK